MTTTVANQSLCLVPLIYILLGCGQPPKEQSVDSDRPNVILIYTDDLGYGDLSSYNPQSKIRTPHIDRLAKEGMRFTDAHSAASFCTPSRYSLLTGRYCWRTEPTSSLQGGYGMPIIARDEMTLGNLFRDNGYRTAAIGKWHVGMEWTLKAGETEPEEENVDLYAPLKFTPNDQGFDYYFGTSGCTSDDSPFAFIKNRELIGGPFEWVEDLNVVGDGDFIKDVWQAKDWRHEAADTIFTNQAMAFIDRQVAADQPFFVYLPLSVPHIPWLPADFVKGTTGADARGDLVALADYCVGKLTAQLEKLGIEDNTLILFTSDNGPRHIPNGHLAAGELRGYKGSIYEGGHRVPFIVKWPGHIPAGTVSDQLIGQVDIYRTLATILGHVTSEGEASDSYDYAGIWRGKSGEEPVREVYVHQFSNQYDNPHPRHQDG